MPSQEMNGNASSPQVPVPCVKLVKGLSQSISDDGSSSLFVTETEDGSKIGLLVAVTALKQFREMFNVAIEKVEKAGHSAGNAPFKRPRAFSVGHSDEMRGTVALMFDPGMMTEEVFVLSDADGLKFAKAVEGDVMGRLSAADRAKLQTGVVGRPKLILPGRMS